MIAALLLAVPLLFSEGLRWDCSPCPAACECWYEERRSIPGTETFRTVFSTRGRTDNEYFGDVVVKRPMCSVRFVEEQPFPLLIEYDRQVREVRLCAGRTLFGPWSAKIRCPKRGA